VTEGEILPLLIEHLQRFFLDPDANDRLRKRLQERQSTPNKEAVADRLKKAITSLDSKILKGERGLAAIDDDMRDGYMSQIRDWKRERAGVRAELDAVLTTSPPKHVVDDLIEQVKQLPKAMESGDAALLRKAFGTVIGSVDLRFDEIKKGSGKRTWRPLLGGTIHLRDNEVLSPSGRAEAR
jgi:hypothetical protein